MSEAVEPNTNLRLSILTNEVAAQHWPSVIGPMLEEALRHSPGWYTTEHLAKDMIDGMARVAIIFDPGDGKVYAVLYLEGNEMPLRKVMNISYLSGVDLQAWIHLYPVLRQWAASQGFNQLCLQGRRAWKRLLSNYVTEQQTQFSDNLDDLLVEAPNGSE